MVVAVSRSGCIGDDGEVPWEYPADVKQYKRRVRGTPVAVGRRTFDMMEPITDSVMLVLTRDPSKESDHDRVRYVTSRREAVECAKDADTPGGENRLSVIGGAGVYQLFAPFADRAFVSEIPESLDGDAYFPYLGANWVVAETTEFERFRLLEYEHTAPMARSKL